MLNKYFPSEQKLAEDNYEEAQRRIAEAMKNGAHYVFLPGKNNEVQFSWCAIPETIEKLQKDGFQIDDVWDPYEYWSVEWYD